ncbi:hypothetical protein FisN_3Lh405 [Fistulifera solaris]|uniref:Uncharacterized protein n=1 Tax=Fistulifera solaris TaxID=1519565 RepID=A0A1Z5J8R3_FISSO|nr:hypothetical protein FisN_3Lh405 [Fistulifera solaris]|eukprot:GAX10208.1 hypothetical protein FisN_3Lh405 [Fistulifera solaris]
MSVSLPAAKEYRDGRLYSVLCEDSSEDVKKLSLEYDYEFALPDPGEPFPEVQWQDLPDVEYGMLRRMNEVTGVGSCDLSVQSEDPWLQSGGSGLHKVVGLTSGEKDTLHPVGECQYINSLRNNLICFAMSGKMDVFYTGPSASVIEDYMMYHLRVELDSQNTLVGSIYQTYFVGKSTDNPYNLVAEDEDRETQNPQSSDSSSGMLPLVLVIPIALALIVAVGLFVTRRRRQSDSSELNSQQVDSENADFDSRNGQVPLSTKSQPMLAETDSFEKSEDEENQLPTLSADSIFDDVESGSMEEVGSDAPMLMDSGNKTDPAMLQNPAVLALAAAASSLTPVGALNPFDLATAGDNTQSGDTLLPPLPPGTRPAKTVASTGQTVRRRRKKKKRKALLSGVPEMATIQETPENSDDEDDESYGSGSEQSWSGAEDGDSPEQPSPYHGSSQYSFDETATLITDNRTSSR